MNECRKQLSFLYPIFLLLTGTSKCFFFARDTTALLANIETYSTHSRWSLKEGIAQKSRF
jgi:hypothetical protein